MIPFSIPFIPETAFTYLRDAVENGHVSSKGKYYRLCEQHLYATTGCDTIYLTTSGTSALDMAAMVIGVKQGDEVIFPSYTYASTVNAFVLRGAVPVFVDVEYDTLNIDVSAIEGAVTDKTKAIVPVHYAGTSCDMDAIKMIAQKHNLIVVEDAAQGICSTYKEKSLGAIADIGCLSFHQSKNVTAGGQGGALLVNNTRFAERADIVFEQGTNRSLFQQGKVDQYEWIDIGSNFTLNEISCAVLWSQLEIVQEINRWRLELWQAYYQKLEEHVKRGVLALPKIPSDCQHNGHVFVIKLNNAKQRNLLQAHFKEHGITAVPHYMPLHSTPGGVKFGRFVGNDRNATRASHTLLRLPLYHTMTLEDVTKVTCTITAFWDRSTF